MKIRMEYILKMNDAVYALMQLNFKATSAEIHEAQMAGVGAEVALKRIMEQIGEQEVEVVA